MGAPLLVLVLVGAGFSTRQTGSTAGPVPARFEPASASSPTASRGFGFPTPSEGTVVEGIPGHGDLPDRLLMSRDGGTAWSEAIAAAHPRSPARIGPAAVWRQAGHGGQLAAYRACSPSHGAGSLASGCIDRYMRAHGASEAAVAFFDATGSYLIGFVDAGQVDLGYTLLAFPANYDRGFLVLNAARQYFHPPPPQLTGALYRKLRDAYRLPSGGAGLTVFTDSIVPWLETSSQRAGRNELILQFTLYNQCAACATPYRARIAYRFSADGAFAGSRSLGPCLAPIRGIPIKAREPACPATRPAPR